MRLRQVFLSSLVALPAVISISHASTTPALTTGNVINGMVENVHDGDGLWLGNGDGNPKNDLAVRLFGIDAPEWNRKDGQEAKKFLAQRIRGQHVRCIVQLIDKHRRPVSICVDDAGKDLSCAIAWAGHAWLLTLSMTRAIACACS